MGLQVRSPSIRTRVHNYTHSGATTALTPVVINSRVLIPVNTAGGSVANNFVTGAEISGVAKETGQAWAVGDAIYWDPIALKMTKTSTSNVLCGRALEAAASGDATAPVFLFDSFTA